MRPMLAAPAPSVSTAPSMILPRRLTRRTVGASRCVAWCFTTERRKLRGCGDRVLFSPSSLILRAPAGMTSPSGRRRSPERPETVGSDSLRSASSRHIEPDPSPDGKLPVPLRSLERRWCLRPRHDPRARPGKRGGPHRFGDIDPDGPSEHDRRRGVAAADATGTWRSAAFGVQ